MHGASPNIILIMADQLVAELTGVYGHPVVRTPNLQRIADDGVRFDAAYCNSPVCSPSRASMLTGQYISEIGAWDNAIPFPSDTPTIPHYLTLRGYHTALAGKMHFVGPDQLHGYETRLTTDVYPSGMGWTPQAYRAGRFKHPDNPGGPPIGIDYVTAGPVQWNDFLQYDEETQYRALEFIRAKRTQIGGSRQVAPKSGDRRPFFLTVSFHHPHEPFQPTRKDWDRYEEIEIANVLTPRADDPPRSVMDDWLDSLHGVDEIDVADADAATAMRRAYYALVSYIDDKVGELLDTVEACGLRDDTIFVFASDHGDMLGERGMIQKRCFYEWSARVPLLVGGGPVARKGKVHADPVSLLDLLPTLCELTGAAPVHASGTSLMAAVTGDGRIEAHDAICEFHSEGVEAPCLMLRRGRWKYIHIHGRDRQLFDMVTDPRELTDLSHEPEHAARIASFEAELGRRFDLDGIAEKVRASYARRHVIRDAMRLAGTRWDYYPDSRSFNSYWQTL